MRLPATHFAGNLMWTRQGTVYASWALTALPSGKSEDDLQMVADAHSAFYRALAGREVLLRGTLVWTDPVAVVARMIDGLDLADLDGWAEECERTIDAVAGLPLGSRLWTLTAPLSTSDWKQKTRTLARAATTELCDQLHVPGMRPADAEIGYYRRVAAALAASWPSPFSHRPLTVAEQLWLLRYAQSRGAEALANPFDLPAATPDQTLTGRAGVGEPLLDPAGMTDVDDPRRIRATAPLRRRWLKTVTDTGTTSYQAGLVLADVPPGGMQTPGGEFLGRLDELGVPADIGVRMTIRTRAEGLRRNKRGFTMLNDQADQIDGSPDVGSLSAGLQEAARQLIEYHERLSINTKEVEIEPVVMVSVAAATPEAADQLALDFVQAPGNKEFTWARPVGAEEDIFWAMQPGGRLSMQLNDYRHITTGADFAAAAPMMTSRLGARKGSLLGLNTTTPLLSTVHLDLAGEAERNFSPSIAITAELGAGKALDVNTPIPTPDGWSLMKDLAPGDQVFDEQGQPTVVVGVSEVMYGRTCYEVVFDDGSALVSDAEHLWTTLPDPVRAAAAKRNHKKRRRGETQRRGPGRTRRDHDGPRVEQPRPHLHDRDPPRHSAPTCAAEPRHPRHGPVAATRRRSASRALCLRLPAGRRQTTACCGTPTSRCFTSAPAVPSGKRCSPDCSTPPVRSHRAAPSSCPSPIGSWPSTSTNSPAPSVTEPSSAHGEPPSPAETSDTSGPCRSPPPTRCFG